MTQSHAGQAQCQAPGCTRCIPIDRVMCGRHWTMVPRSIRRQYDAAAAGAAQVLALQTAIAAVVVRVVRKRIQLESAA